MDKQELLNAINNEEPDLLSEEMREVLQDNWAVIAASPIEYESMNQLLGFIRSIDHDMAVQVQRLLVEPVIEQPTAEVVESTDPPPTQDPESLKTFTDSFFKSPFAPFQRTNDNEEVKKELENLSRENAEIKDLLQQLLYRL